MHNVISSPGNNDLINLASYLWKSVQVGWCSMLGFYLEGVGEGELPSHLPATHLNVGHIRLNMQSHNIREVKELTCKPSTSAYCVGRNIFFFETLSFQRHNTTLYITEIKS